jgi:thymidylate synthase (FAD)
MKVELLHFTPLHICAKAIRKCWASEDKSDTCVLADNPEYDDTYSVGDIVSTTDGKYTYVIRDIRDSCFNNFVEYRGKTDLSFYKSEIRFATPYEIENHQEDIICGPKDKELIDRIGNKNKHSSTLEHLVYSFDIDGIPRATLQELARHRIAGLSVKSSRYTLKELKNEELVRDAYLFNEDTCKKYIVFTGNEDVDTQSCAALLGLQNMLEKGISNDIAKFCMPEAYKTSLVWTINARSLQNFLSLRSNKSALWSIRNLAKAVFEALPEEHKYLFEHCMYKEEN